MRPTLFYLPHELFGIPLLGFGWVLGFLVMGIGIYLFATKNKRPISKTVSDLGFVWIAAAAVVVFLLPRIETHVDDGTPNGWTIGLPIRGYGVTLMLGVISAISIAMSRCKKAGVSQDDFFSLATWVIVFGLIGARVFYVVQKWSEIEGTTFVQKLYTSLKFTEGGLVVYGSVIGGLIAVLLWTRKRKIPLLPTADAVTPAFFIGLAFGRIGCLLNGCCYGGTCEPGLPSITFPSGSPAYMDQLATGKLLGMVTNKEPSPAEPEAIRAVLPNSWASQNKIEVGQTLNRVSQEMVGGITKENPLSPPVFDASVQINGRTTIVPSTSVPSQSLAVHPSQIYAAISGLLLCAWTFLLSERSKRPGVVFGSGIIGYGIFRIIEEFIRVDEAGLFGTPFSIAQWISIAAILLGAVVLAVAKSRTVNTNESA
jgi:phosphatidylglycerol:prolipoprotein diacylglycerol transferase